MWKKEIFLVALNMNKKFQVQLTVDTWLLTKPVCFENIFYVISDKSVTFHSEILKQGLFKMMG